MSLAKKIAITGMVFVLILLVFSLAIKIFAHYQAPNSTYVPAKEGPIGLSAYVSSHGVFSYSNDTELLAYALLNYNFQNALQANMSLTLYSENPLSKIYVLNESNLCYQCYNESAFYTYLFSYLSKYDLVRNSSSISMVNMSELAAVPDNSTVMIASGLLPVALVNGTGTQSLYSLLNRGDTVIYIGRNFTNLLAYSPTRGSFIEHNPYLVSELESYNIIAEPFNANVSSYSSSQLIKSPTFSLVGGKSYQGISYVKSLNGTFVAFSNYPKSGWSNASALASALAQSLHQVFWIPQLSYGQQSLSVGGSRSGVMGVFTSQIPIMNSADIGAEINASYPIVSIALSNQSGEIFDILPVKLNFTQSLAAVRMSPLVNIGQVMPVSISIYNITNSSGIINAYSLEIYSSNLTYETKLTVPTPPSANVSVSPFNKFLINDIPSGYYLALLKNYNGKTYAGAVFQVANISISQGRIFNYANGTFVFGVFGSGDAPISNVSFNVSLNGANPELEKAVNGTLIYVLPAGTQQNYGNQVFRFSFAGSVYTFSSVNTQQTLQISPQDAELVAVILVVIFINLVLKPPKKDEFYIDVPTFSRTKKEVVKSDTVSVLNVFDRVNFFYKWKYMPLTIDEIKNGINNYIRYKGMPISITTQNANIILGELIDKKLILENSSYYAPTSWVAASKHDIEYLVIFRKLRDFCVSHSMLFTELGASSASDMIITKTGKQINVIIYSSVSGMASFKINTNVKTFIVFIDANEKKKFQDKLAGSYSKAGEELRLAVEYNYVRLADTDHLSDLLE